MLPLSNILRDEMMNVQSRLDNAIEDVRNGTAIDLSDLQSRSENLCASILKLPGADAKTFQSDIAETIRKLDILEKALQEQAKSD